MARTQHKLDSLLAQLSQNCASKPCFALHFWGYLKGNFDLKNESDFISRAKSVKIAFFNGFLA